jgi:E3 ubiquitin-protein ligase HUWE1
MNGADFMKIEKSNVLMTSLAQSKKVNMYKEVKIEFIGDKVNDAGGLLREWMHLVIKEVFDKATGIFGICKTDDLMYRLKWDEEIDEEFSAELLMLFGTILGKAIFEKIPINSYLDRTLLRQLSSRQNNLELYDIFGYDKEVDRSSLSSTKTGVTS